MKENTTRMPPDLRAAAEALAASLERSAPLDAYREAEARLGTDDVAKLILGRLEEAQRDVRRRQQEGAVTRDDIQRIRAAQQEAFENPVIERFASTRQQALDYLPGVNGVISELIGWDFASMAGSGGC